MAGESDELVMAPRAYSIRLSDNFVKPESIMDQSAMMSNGDLGVYSSSTEEYPTAAESPDDDVEHGSLMDRRMFMQATQGQVDDFKKGLVMAPHASSSAMISIGDLGPTPILTRINDKYHEDVEHGKLMDRRMFMQATQGRVDEFDKVLDEISMEKELRRSEIFCQVSPQRNTCLHIAASLGHVDLARYIVEECPQLIKMKNSRGDTALHIAARRNDSITFVNFVIHSCHSGSAESRDIEKAESLLRIVNHEKNTVLHEALIHHCKEIAKVLIEADPQAAYCPNKERKTPLYLAAEAQYLDVVKVLETKKPTTKERDGKVKPAIYGAILGKNKEMLEKILAMEAGHQKDEDGRTPLHCAASIGYLEGVQTLLRQSNFDRYQRDNEGLYPIHVASKRGYVAIVKELLRFSPDSKELLIKHGENILHVAAKCGKDNVVNFVLKEKGIEKLINEKNSRGNTPLHLATMHGHPKVVSSLTWDKRVDVNLVNKKGQTALDIASSVGHPLTFHQRLIWITLKSADAQPARESKVKRSGSADAQPPPESKVPPSGSAGAQIPPESKVPPSGSAGAQPSPESKVPPSGCPELSNPPHTKEFKDRVNTLLLVSTLVATVTFAAGFTMPGGYNSSGMANMLTRNIFHVFVICDTIAMYSSILAVITLIWAQLDDLCLMYTAIKWALPFLGLAVTAMSLAFMAGVYLVVSNLHWLAIVVSIIGSIGLVSLLVPFLLLLLPSESTNCILRYVSYYSFHILIWASSPKIKRKD